MISMIVTDYRNISQAIDVCLRAAEKYNESVHYIIVDNSDRHDGIIYLNEHNINYDFKKICGKDVYTFEIGNERIVLIDADSNGGYAKGNNLGAKIAKELYRDELYIISNSDLEFPETIFCDKLQKIFLENPDIGIIGPDILYHGKERQNPKKFRGIWTQDILGDFNARWFHCIFNPILSNIVKNPKEGEADWVMGCYMIFSSAAFDEIGGFDENTFLYGEEMIICVRMKEKGYKTYYYPELKIIHNHQGVDGKKMRKILHTSKMYYYKKYCKCSRIEILLANISFEITEVGYYLYHDLLKNKIMLKEK